MAQTINTLDELAELCGVSGSTISRVLNDEPGISSETRNTVLKTAKKYNFTLKKRKKPIARATLSFLVVIPDKSETSWNPFFEIGELYEAIHNTFSKEKKNVEVTTFTDFNLKTTDYLYGTDAVIFAFGETEMQKQKELIDINIPYIFLNRMDGCENYVSLNNFRGMESLTKLLIDNGHKKIGYLGWSTKSVNQDRFKGYMSACYDAGMNISTLSVKNVSSYDEINSNIVDYFLKEKCDGICCFNDIFAIRIINCLQSAGKKVPKDISITGFDNSVMRQHFRPLITTLNLSVYEMGFFATRWLRDIILRKEKRTLRLEIDGEIIEGETVLNRK